jgi:inhibitor of cysteine peptidase
MMRNALIIGFALFFVLNLTIAVSFAAHEVNVDLGDQFSISLDSNPSTGYTWDALYDPEYLKLMSEVYVPDESGSDPPVVGVGGNEVFTFEALKTGQSTINFNYHPAWNDEPVDTVEYDINILDPNPDTNNTTGHSTNTIPMQNTGTPLNLLLFAGTLMGLGSMGLFKK